MFGGKCRLAHLREGPFFPWIRFCILARVPGQAFQRVFHLVSLFSSACFYLTRMTFLLRDLLTDPLPSCSLQRIRGMCL